MVSATRSLYRPMLQPTGCALVVLRPPPTPLGGCMFRQTRRGMAWLQWALAALTLVAVAPRPSAAQFERGTISGTIVDQQGGVVPGVTVTAVHVQTQQPRTTLTDASGFYTFPNLTPGVYDLTVELDGFKKTTRAAIQLDAAASIAI